MDGKDELTLSEIEIAIVSNTKGIHFSYERYLMNQIRETFCFDSVPLELVFRKKK